MTKKTKRVTFDADVIEEVNKLFVKTIGFEAPHVMRLLLDQIVKTKHIPFSTEDLIGKTSRGEEIQKITIPVFFKEFEAWLRGSFVTYQPPRGHTFTIVEQVWGDHAEDWRTMVMIEFDVRDAENVIQRLCDVSEYLMPKFSYPIIRDEIRRNVDDVRAGKKQTLSPIFQEWVNYCRCFKTEYTR